MRGSKKNYLFYIFEVSSLAKKCMAGIIIVLILLNINSLIFKSPKRYEAEFITVFDTVTKIISYSNSKAEFEKHSKLIYDNLMKYHKLFDIYNNYEGINNIKTINDNVGIAPVKVDREIIDLLLFAKQVYYKTDGKVNVAFGAVLKIWHNYRTQGIENPSRAEVPPIHLLKEAEKHTDINNLIINEADSTVYLADPYMSLDVGHCKGYATEKVSLYAKQHEFTSGVISVGGNVRAIGNKIIDRQHGILGCKTLIKKASNQI